MPYLDKGQLGEPHANLYLFSIMLAPGSPEAQRRIFKCFTGHLDYRAIQLFGPLIEVRHSAGVRDFLYEDAHKDLDQMLLNAAPIDLTGDSIQADFAEGLTRGRHAGRILNWILENRASLNRAFEKFADHKMRRRTQQNLWQQMMPAAHLWANAVQRPIPGDARLGDWLLVAEETRLAGETFIPRHGHEPVLDPVQVWRLP
jgi:hypothetical protein